MFRKRLDQVLSIYSFTSKVRLRMYPWWLVKLLPFFARELTAGGFQDVAKYGVSQYYPNMYFSTIIATALKPLKMWKPKCY